MKQELHQNWHMKSAEESEWQEAAVPGTVYTDLLRNKSMEDPFFRDREDSACALMEKDYLYECTFVPEQGMLASDRILLHFDGLDTVAEVYLNDIRLGAADNMHRIWEYDITGVINAEENLLRLLFHSPLQYIAEAYQTYGNIGNEDTYEGFMHLRKAHYMFGWDWGAHLPDAGIFRPVSLIGMKTARFDSVLLRQEHQRSMVKLLILPTVQNQETWSEPEIFTPEGSGLTYEVLLTAPDGEEKSYRNSPSAIEIENPQLWWPNGLGDQPLYTVKVMLYKGTRLLDIWQRKIGLRTLTMRREKDEWGECFAHEINGQTVFAMGADYIPEDHLLGRTNREKTEKLLRLCKWAHYNTIRVWGGGYYPEDWFYELCDELGLMVWQDFMFACSVYELTEQFEANIRREFIDNIKRIRHHASLALWCGNNEMEMFVEERCWVTKATEVRDYLFMYERIIPEVLKQYDPDTFYWPASPSSGGSFDFPNDPDRGDVHYWTVWHGNKPFSEYRKHFFRYASEFGFQAFPSVKTLEQITDRESDLNPFSYVMEKHQRNYGANGKIMNYLQQTFLYPHDFGIFVYASQLLQAEAIRYGVEHFRRNRGRCMGAIYWQLNDCWPVISWSSVDYCGRLKALHYYARRFFAPVMISCQEEGMMSAEANMNRQHFAFEKSIRLNVANETRKDQLLQVCWAVRNQDAAVVSQSSRTVLVPALSAVWLDKEMLPQIQIFDQYVSYEVKYEGEVLSEGTVIFSYPKYFHYADPGLTWYLEGQELVIHANAYAKSVSIQNKQEDMLLSDNFFDMNAGEKRVTVLSGNTEEIRLTSVYDIR